jgi:hypothetical protein
VANSVRDSLLALRNGAGVAAAAPAISTSTGGTGAVAAAVEQQRQAEANKPSMLYGLGPTVQANATLGAGRIGGAIGQAAQRGEQIINAGISADQNEAAILEALQRGQPMPDMVMPEAYNGNVLADIGHRAQANAEAIAQEQLQTVGPTSMLVQAAGGLASSAPSMALNAALGALTGGGSLLSGPARAAASTFSVLGDSLGEAASQQNAALQRGATMQEATGKADQALAANLALNSILENVTGPFTGMAESLPGISGRAVRGTLSGAGEAIQEPVQGVISDTIQDGKLPEGTDARFAKEGLPAFLSSAVLGALVPGRQTPAAPAAPDTSFTAQFQRQNAARLTPKTPQEILAEAVQAAQHQVTRPGAINAEQPEERAVVPAATGRPDVRNLIARAEEELNRLTDGTANEYDDAGSLLNGMSEQDARRFGDIQRAVQNRNAPALQALLGREQDQIIGPSAQGVSANTPGWYEGNDGIPRLEIADNPNGIRVPTNEGRFTLEQVYDNPALFEAYPQLRNMPVTTIAGGGNVTGDFNPETGIRIGLGGNEQNQSLIHEVQHAIQDIEGFARGAREGELDNVPASQLDSYAIRQSEQQLTNPNLGAAERARIERSIRQERNAFRNMTPEQRVQTTSGEEEAYTAEDRMLMTEAERLANPIQPNRSASLITPRAQVEQVQEDMNVPIAAALGDLTRDYNQFVGTRSETANLDNLQTAEDWEKQGKTAKQIRRQTGWYRGADNLWRTELADKPEAISLDRAMQRGATVATVYQNHELLAAYPQLSDIRVRLAKMEDGTGGYFDETKNEIVLNQSLLTDQTASAKRIIVHEVQHAIQGIEGFARGSNPTYMHGRQKVDTQAIRALTQRLNSMPENHPQRPRIQAEIDRRIAAAQAMPGADRYYNTAGEIEARDAAARMNFEQGMRKSIDPVVKEDSEILQFGERSFNQDASDRNFLAVRQQPIEHIASDIDRGHIVGPSIAMLEKTARQIGRDTYGDATAVYRPDAIDPKKNKRNVLYEQDAWTELSVFPEPRFTTDSNQKILDEVFGVGSDGQSDVWFNPKAVSEDGAFAWLFQHPKVRRAYAEATGNTLSYEDSFINGRLNDSSSGPSFYSSQHREATKWLKGFLEEKGVKPEQFMTLESTRIHKGETVKAPYNPKKAADFMYKNDRQIDDVPRVESLDAFKELVSKSRQRSYGEAKPYRVVTTDEIVGYALPKSYTPPELLKLLEDRGIAYELYDDTKATVRNRASAVNLLAERAEANGERVYFQDVTQQEPPRSGLWQPDPDNSYGEELLPPEPDDVEDTPVTLLTGDGKPTVAEPERYVANADKSPVYSSVMEQLKGTNVSFEESQAQAKLYSVAVENFAKTVGVDPTKLWESLNFKIQQQDLTTADGKRRRGNIRFSTDGGITVAFDPNNRDVTTLFHEQGHFFSEMVQRVAELAPDNVQAVSQWNTLKNFVGWKDDQQFLTSKQHEMLANGYMNYIATGQAPTPELKSLFSQFKAWMSNLWAGLTDGERVMFTEEVRNVFDNLLATDAAFEHQYSPENVAATVQNVASEPDNPILQDAVKEEIKAAAEADKPPVGKPETKKTREGNMTIVDKVRDRSNIINPLRALLNSPSKLAAKYVKFNPIYQMGVAARRAQDTMREHYNHSVDKVFGKMGLFGGRTGGYASSDEDRAGVFHALLEGDALGVEFTDAELNNLGISENAKKGYKAIRNIYKRVGEKVSAQRVKYKKEALNMREGYVTHIFKTWRVYGNGGKILDTFATRNEAVKYARTVQKDNKHVTVKPAMQDFSGAMQQDAVTLGDLQYFKVVKSLADKFEVSTSEIMEATGDSIRMASKARRFNYAEQRKGYEGYNKDMEYAVRHYANYSARYLAMDEFKHKARQYFERTFGRFDSDHKNSGLARYSKNYIRDVLGEPSAAEQWLNSVIWSSGLDKFLPDHFQDRPAIALTSKLSSITATAKLGFLNVASAVLNLTSLNGTMAMVGYGNTAKAVAQYLHPTLDTRRIYRGVGLDTDITMENASQYSSMQRMGGVWKAMNGGLFSFFDGASRKISAIAGYEEAISKGLKGKEAYAYARDVVDKTNFNYGVEDAPDLFRRSGPGGQLLFQFKKYPIKMLELAMPGMGHLKGMQQIKFWGGQMVLAGVLGAIPGFDILKGAIKSMFDDEDIELEIKKVIAESDLPTPLKKAVLYGALSNMGIDVSQRQGMQDIFSVDPLANPSFQLVADVLKAIPQMSDPAAVLDLIKNVVPGVGNPMKAFAGETYDNRGRVRYKYKNNKERGIRAAGLTPIGETLERDATRIANYDKQQTQQEQQRAIDAYLQNPGQEERDELRRLKVKPERIIAAKKQQRSGSNMERLLQSNRRNRDVRNTVQSFNAMQ